MTRTTTGLLILRFGLAVMFLWFGFSQVFDTSSWAGWVPTWAEDLTGLEAEMVVLLNGSFEIVMGTLLALGLYVRPAAFLLGVHVAVLVFEIGANDIGLRDFGLMAACFALALLGPDEYSLDG